MKRIVRGNDFTMRIPVVKIVDGEKVAFPLPGCTDIMVRLCSAYRRLELAHTIDAKEDNVIVARVEGDRIPLGTYALEVRGKIFGNDWRSNEYEQVAIVDRNADADTELGETDEGENSVEMDTAVVVLPPDRELEALVKEAQAQNKAMSELSDTIKASEEGRVKSEELRAKSEEARVQAELTRASTEAERTKAEQVRENNEGQRLAAEQGRVTAENARADAETARVEAENARVTAEDARADAENARASAESARVTAESARVDAENTRVTAEGERVTAEGEREQGFTEKAAHLEELLQYIKDNHLEPDVKLAEAIKNTIKGTDEFVYLDGSDGNVKSMPNTGRLGPSAAAVYYAGKRSVMPGESYMVIGYQKNELIRSFDLSGWDFEAATDMARFLYFASGLQTLTLPENVMLGNVTNMSQCFYECRHLLSLDTSKWTLANVTDMNGCFYGCGSLQSLDTSKWTLANVTDMNGCFYGCGSLQSLDTSKWTLANVTNMNGCFYGCGSLQSLDTSKWTLANVTNMNGCFYDCESLREIDLSSCNITKCRNWDHCFTTLDNLETLRIGLIDFSPCGSINFFPWETNPRELTGTLRGIRDNFRAVSSRMTRDSCMVVINGLEMVTEAKTLTLGVNNKPVSLGGKGSDPISDDDLKIATDKGWTVQFG
jgi:surface protein